MKTDAEGRTRELLKTAAKQAHRLRGGLKPSDLHDFRVAVRRLQVHLRSCKSLLPIPKSARRALKRLLGRTNSLRDVQIEGEWLARHGVGKGALAAAVLRRHRGKKSGRWIWRRFEAARRPLKKALRHVGPEARDKELSLAAMKAASRGAFARLSRLCRAQGDLNGRSLHKIRIAVKKFRYSLEPIGSAAGLPSLSDCKRLQDVLGELHDRGIIAADLEAAAQERRSFERELRPLVAELNRDAARLRLRANRELAELRQPRGFGDEK